MHAWLYHTQGIPYGHLRPLGYQRHTSGPIDTLPQDIEILTLASDYLETGKAVKIEKYFDVEDHEDWLDDEKLRLKCRGCWIEAIERLPNRNGAKAPLHMSLKRFLERYKHDEIQLSSAFPHNMLGAVPLPHAFQVSIFVNINVKNA